jgi:hypothetical protein
MAIEQYGQSALVGWRKPVAERVAPALEKNTPLDGDQARALIGATFFVLSVIYVVGTIRRVLSEA